MFNKSNQQKSNRTLLSMWGMKRVVLAILLGSSMAMPMLAHAEDKASPTAEKTKPAKKKSASERKAEAEVLATFQAMVDASNRHDIEAFARFFADDFVTTDEGIQSKQDAINRTKSDWAAILPGVKEYQGPPDPIKVILHGDTAFVLSNHKEFLEMGGQTNYCREWEMDTFIRRGKKWLAVASPVGVIPVEPPVAKVDPAIYDAYVGQYESAPTLISTISREGDKLISRGGKVVELLPENETTFFARGDTEGKRVIFVKDASGRVTHAIQRQLGWTDRIVKKIK